MPVNIVVESKENEPFDHLMIRWSKKIRNQKFMEEIYSRLRFEKPSAKRRKRISKSKCTMRYINRELNK